MKSVHSDRLERWLGAQQAAHLSAQMVGWYGTPIPVANAGMVHVNKLGDFEGKLPGGQFASLDDYLDDMARRERRRRLARMARHTRQLGGFANADEARSFTQHQRLNINKFVSPGNNALHSAWRQTATLPGAGAAAAAAPGGTVPTSATAGAISFVNPATGTTHFLGAELSGTNTNGTLLLYDRIFGVAKAMNSTATEAVTGVPTRYQSTTRGAVDSAENNFLFVEVGTVLPATAHNWTVCTYTDQSGNAGATLPSLTGISAAAANRLDHATWYAPLAADDTGILALTQMQCSALVATGAVDFVIGHPIAWIPVTPRVASNEIVRDERINSAINFARIFDNACLALLASSGNVTLSVAGQILIGAR